MVVGGGFSGSSAAACARNAGAEVTLIERTDHLLGLGIQSGLYYNDGRMAAVEELRAVGGSYIINILESPEVLTHPRLEMNWAAADALQHRPREQHIFHCARAETHIRDYLREIGVNIIFEKTAVDVEVGRPQNNTGNRLVAIKLNDGQRLEADAWVDTSGGAGGRQICIDYGYGCVECELRCNTYGDRVSIATKAGAPELRKLRDAEHGGGFGALSSQLSFYDDSIDPKLLKELKENGTAHVEVPPEVRNFLKVGLSTSMPYDPSHVKIIKFAYPGFVKANGMVYMPLEDVRRIPGFKHARMCDPFGGGVGNAVRFMSMAPRENSLRVYGFSNLFVGGEKSGPNVGIQEAVITGALAGHNAARTAFNKDLLVLPPTTLIGDFLAFVQEMMQSETGLMRTYAMFKPPYRMRMAQKGWWAKTVSQAIEESKQRIEAAGLTGVMAQKLT